MSSFVVNKEDYIKFAGIISGICANTQKSVSTKNIYSDMVRCYERNVASVNEQYNANDESDKKAYKSTFVSWEQKGGYIYNASIIDKKVATKTINELSEFISSCLYQIENEEMASAVSSNMHHYLNMAIESFCGESPNSWGDLYDNVFDGIINEAAIEESKKDEDTSTSKEIDDVFGEIVDAVARKTLAEFEWINGFDFNVARNLFKNTDSVESYHDMQNNSIVFRCGNLRLTIEDKNGLCKLSSVVAVLKKDGSVFFTHNMQDVDL